MKTISLAAFALAALTSSAAFAEGAGPELSGVPVSSQKPVSVEAFKDSRFGQTHASWSAGMVDAKLSTAYDPALNGQSGK